MSKTWFFLECRIKNTEAVSGSRIFQNLAYPVVVNLRFTGLGQVLIKANISHGAAMWTFHYSV